MGFVEKRDDVLWMYIDIYIKLKRSAVNYISEN